MFFVPFDTVNTYGYVPWSCTLAIVPSWKDRIMSTNVSGQPSFANVFQSPVMLTESKALLRSVKNM